MEWIRREWKRLWPYFTLLDFGASPSTRVAWLVRVAVVSFGVIVLWKRLDTTTATLFRAKPPVRISNEEIEDYRFRFPERTRREIFAQIADAEQITRASAIQKNSWAGHLWSREDDRGHYERVFLRTLGQKYGASLTQMYLILDEGIRNHWPGPDGEPLPATTPPLNPRQTL